MKLIKFLVMTQKDKELLLQDLCGRIPYRVKMNHIADIENNPITLVGVAKTMITLESPAGYGTSDIEDYIPYLFPLSSMTEEQKKEYRKVCELDTEILSKHPMDGTPFPTLYNSQDWLNKNHFDYRGLIPLDLAIDATNLEIY